ncbi:MAG: YtxH domain-containing protein [Chloroflexi bacterium]|nr:YtxH domain-containing protein [Chloroflexota bacterium]
MKTFLNFVAGVVIGALAGGAAALLLAPKNGADLRKDLRGEVDEILAEGRRSARQRRAELEDQLVQLRRQ